MIRAGMVIGAIALATGAGTAWAVSGHVITRTEMPGGVRLTAEPTEPAAQVPANPPSMSPLTFTKSVANHRQPLGGLVTYVFSVTNDGNSAVAGAVVDDGEIVKTAVADGRLAFADLDFIDIPLNASAVLIFDFDPTSSTFVLVGLASTIGPGETFSFKVVFRVNGPEGASVTNQASLQLNCTSTSTPCSMPVVALSDDPSVPGAEDPTVIAIIGPATAPTLGPVALAVSASGLVLAGVRLLQRRRRPRNC
jgi:hypothetical protein